MPERYLESIVNQRWLDTAAAPLSRAVRSTLSDAGPFGRQARNALHGVWLGHPLHPVLTDIPIGAWTTAVALDARHAATRYRGDGRAADFAIGLGLIGAVGAAVTGLADWSETEGRSRRVGLLHGLLNVAATGLMAASYVLRRRGSRSAGRSTAAAGYGIALAAAYLGGDLVYGERIGVTHAAVAEPESFAPVLESGSLRENTMAKAVREDATFLLVRQGGRVCALAHPCAHLGGPLSEGTLKDGSVVCPWHGSEFALDDGRVLNGPATQPQPCVATRERDGWIEIGPRTG